MSKNSPYGEVSGLRYLGTVSHKAHSIKFRMILFTEEDTEQRELVPTGGYRAELEWNGTGVREYPYLLARGQELRVHVAFTHSAHLSMLRLTTSIYFYGRGHIFFPVAEIDTREQYSDFAQFYKIPLNIERQEMSFGTAVSLDHLRNNKPRFVDLEALYGMPLRDKQIKEEDRLAPLVERLTGEKRTKELKEKQKERKKAKIDPLGLPELPDLSLSLLDAKDAAERAERQHVEHVLEPLWWEFVTYGLRMIFADKTRVRHMLRYWRAAMDVAKYDTLAQKYAAFIQAVLSAQFHLVVTESFVSFMAPHQLFMIPRTHLTQDELVFVNQLVVNRKDLFHAEHVQYSHYKLEEFRLDHLLPNEISPRFIVQQLCLDGFEEMRETQDASVVSVLLAAVAQCVRQRPADMFVSYLRHAFDQPRRAVQDIEHIGAFVEMLPNTVPEYKRMSAAKRKMINGHPTTPLVPSSLLSTGGGSGKIK